MRRAIALVLLPLLLATGAAGVAAASPAAPQLPKVSGGFGEKPTISFPKASPPNSLVVKVLHQGRGAKVAKGNLLVANYVGEIWRGKVFDSSFARKQLASFPIGVNQVIPGWDKGLVGTRVGSRILLVLPPADGYGPTGNSQAGITGKDTIVFVVDVVAAYGAKVHGDAHAARIRSKVNGVSVTGPLAAAPTVRVAKSAAAPKKITTVLLARGTGRKVAPGLVILQLVAVSWANKVVDSTWTSGTPSGDVVADPAAPSVLDSLVGLPIGSRVLIELPKNASGGPYAVAADIVAEPRA